MARGKRVRHCAVAALSAGSAVAEEPGGAPGPTDPAGAANQATVGGVAVSADSTVATGTGVAGEPSAVAAGAAVATDPAR
ncbi:hypothetical protein DSM43518_03713 [Mycobacterium marinum]|nr:hypothetical protein DSM43518_03713 [Mycobacterium marinum]